MDASSPPGPAATRTSAGATALSGAVRSARDGLLAARRSWRVIVQATVATSLAYAAAQAIGHETPFFAPIAALATVAISLAQRLRRASELVVGNAIGILLADFLIARIGTGAWQLGLVVAIALTSALIAGGGPILIMQSSSAAILIATITPPTPDQPWNTGRFVDALIGGGIGLLVAALLMPVDPARHAREATDPVLATLADGYRRVAAALVSRERSTAGRVLADLRGTAPLVASFHAGLDETRETVRLAPWYWGQRTLLTSYALAGFHLDNALRNLRVLSRQAEVALDRGDLVPVQIPVALDDLAAATDALGAVLGGDAEPAAARRHLLAAVAHATAATRAGDDAAWDAASAATRATSGLFTAAMVGQIRLSASDLMQVSGLSSAEAATALRAAADAPA